MFPNKWVDCDFSTASLIDNVAQLPLAASRLLGRSEHESDDFYYSGGTEDFSIQPAMSLPKATCSCAHHDD